MATIASAVVVLVAALHACFLVLEMFLWDKPVGLGVFRQSRERALETKVLAANQGLYNGFLAAGLLWGVARGTDGVDVTVFFLSCVIIAGVFGAMTVSRRIFVVQALPALLGLVLVLAGR